MDPKKRTQLYRWTIIIGSILAVVSASEKMINSPLATGDMEAYLHAARLMRAGTDVYATPSRPPEMGGLYYIYPPPLAVLFIPLTFLPVGFAIVLWCVINLVLVGWIVKAFYEGMTGLRFFALPVEDRWTIVFFSVLPPSRFILHHLFYGQANILILALAVLGLREIHRARSLYGGVAVGLSVAIKIITYPFGIWFLLRKNFRAVTGVIAGCVAGFLLPGLVLGFGRNLDYLIFWFRNVALYNLRDAKVPLSVNVSLQAQLHRFFSDGVAFTFDGRPHYMTVYHSSDMSLRGVEQSLLVLMFLALGLYWYKFRHREEVVSNWGGIALIFSLIPVFSPFSQKHYFVLLLPAFVYLVHVWCRLKLNDTWFRRLVIGSFALLFFTNEELCGEWLGAIFTGAGCIAWGSLLATAAIFRSAACLSSVATHKGQG